MTVLENRFYEIVPTALWNISKTNEAILKILAERLPEEKQYVWVFTAEQAWEGDTEDTIVRTFATEEAARKHLQEFITGDGEDESIRQYVERKGWEVDCDEPDHYRVFEDGYYANNHIECTIIKCEIKK